MSKIKLLLFVAVIVFRTAGFGNSAVVGPDSFGYRISNEIPSSFIDISSTGQLLLTGDDNSTGVNLGFGFDFYGVNYTSAFVSTNGLVTFSSGYSNYSNESMSAFTQPVVAVYWDDLITNQAGSGVYVQTIGNPGDRQFIVQWHNMDHYSSSPSTVTIQAAFRESTQNILMRYRDTVFGYGADNGAQATIGISNGSGVYLQWSFDQVSVFSGDTLAAGRNLNNESVPEPSMLLIGSIFGVGGLIGKRRLAFMAKAIS